MADFLIDHSAQTQIAKAIDTAVKDVLSELPNHGSEEALTPVLGHSLSRQSLDLNGLKVCFNYRQHNKRTEEPFSGADGGFLVRVSVPGRTVNKAALFQAKLLKGDVPIRSLKMKSTDDAKRLRSQCQKMLEKSRESVAIFYTNQQVYVVDAAHYTKQTTREPLSISHRLVTLGTYLGKWMPRCTKGDESEDFISRVERPDGFKHGIEMEVLCTRDPVPWKSDQNETRWRA
jgi:hypothetical protein